MHYFTVHYSFYTELTSAATSLENGGPIVFTDVKLNVGSAYSSTSGRNYPLSISLAVIINYSPQRSMHALGQTSPCPVHAGIHPPRADTSPGQTPPWADTTLSRHPLGRYHPGQTPLGRHDPNGHCSRRYASSWNAFLL